MDVRRTATPTKKAADLHAFVDGMDATFPPDISAEGRGKAAWSLIRYLVEHIEPVDIRAALAAALHLDPTNREASIDKRLAFARDRGDFGVQASGKKPGYDALRHWWGDGARRLGHAVDEQLSHLREHPEQWREYLVEVDEPRYRTPFRGAQPVFAELFVTTVFMKRRSVRRRITERLVTAQEDCVRYYTAWALPEALDASTSVPVNALWGCRAERMSSLPGEPILTRLWFPEPLRRGQRHFFASEALVGNIVKGTERRAINVEVDHHGIAPGRRVHDAVPVGGLTIRVRFDLDDLPDAVWWYADVAERERYQRPVTGDVRWLEVTSQGEVEHTFTEPCQPRASYGLAFAWPTSSD